MISDIPQKIQNKGFKIKQKDNERIIEMISPSKEDDINNRLQMLKFLTEVQSSVKKEITEDYVLAKLGDKDKEAVIEMTSNAFFCKRIVELMKFRANKNQYTWNHETKEWELKSLTDKENELIKIQADHLFSAFMNRLHMTVILNRNVERNPLLRLITDSSADEKEEYPNQIQEEKSTAWQKLMGKLKGKENEPTVPE